MEMFASRLRRLREQKQLSIKDIAKAAGVPTSTYREWEYGRLIKGEPYPKLAGVLGVSLHELLTGQKPTKTLALEKIRIASAALKDLETELLSL
jgi:transcriptional regulator with XRE-family HTH domain